MRLLIASNGEAYADGSQIELMLELAFIYF